MTTDEIRDNALAHIDAAQDVVRRLPAGSPIAAVLTDAYIEECREWVRGEADLEDTIWPPLLLWTMMPWHTAEQVALLDEDIRRIRDHPTSDSVRAVGWLSSKGTQSREWRGGLFEAAVKARALVFADATEGCGIAFDVALPNGRDVDIVLSTEERSYYLECTVITESDEDQAVHAAWLEARKKEPTLLLARPGPFDPPAAKGPSLYYDANRIYIKVYDKLQKGGDPARTQTSDDHPNILLLSCFPIHSTPLPFSPALGWAFDELFDGQPNMGSVKQMPSTSAIPDISLTTFLKGQWPERAHDLLPCPARLGGVLTFNCLGFQWGRVNYNANDPQRLSHAEMALLEQVFTPIRGWEILSPTFSGGVPGEDESPDLSCSSGS